MYTFEWGKKNSPVYKDAFDLRCKVFVDEQKFHEEADDYDTIADHLVIYNESVPIGTGRIIDIGDNVFKLGRICILKEYREKGIGSLIMEELERNAKSQKCNRLILSAQLRVADFYRAVGYTSVGDIYLDEHCEHIDMYKIISEGNE